VTRFGPPLVVFDCMIFLQATANPTGPAARLFVEFVDPRRLVLCVSDRILEEVRDVLRRPRIRAKNPAMSDESVARFLDRIARVARRIAEVPAAYPLPRDPDDEPYLNLAIAVSADFLVTRDNDLLDLMKDADFHSRCPTLRILDPVSLLRILVDPESTT